MKRLRVHMIADDDLMRQLSVATKLVATPQVLHQLQVAGQAAAEAFLDAHLGAIGTDSSVDLRDDVRLRRREHRRRPIVASPTRPAIHRRRPR
jgi:hypothetical protein